MDAHDAHDVGVFRDDIGAFHIGSILFQALRKAHEAGNTAVPVGFVFCRVFFQQANVCKAAFSAGHGAHDVLVTGFGAQHIDKAVRRHGGSERSETRQLIAHTHTALVFGVQKRNVQRLFPAPAAQLCHIFRCEAVNGAHQNGEQRNVLIRVIDDV